jgi:exodeoxyribonuclease V alpha subunit
MSLKPLVQPNTNTNSPNSEQPQVPLSELEGVIERITFQNEENAYTIAKLIPAKGRDGQLVTIVGTLPGVVPGESLHVYGYWRSHSQYGKQLEVRNYKTVLPATITGIQKYLGSGLIKGIGPKTSEKIVKIFGPKTLEILETNPQRLIEVPSLGQKKVEIIKKAWAEQKAIKEVMVFLQGQGITTALAVRIYKEYGDASITVVKNDPYRLAEEVFGIGFKTSDKIAEAMGIAKDDPERLKAGVKFVLSEATDEGHVFLPKAELIKRSKELLEAGEEQIEAALEVLQEERKLETERLLDLEDIKPATTNNGNTSEGFIGVSESPAPYILELNDYDPWLEPEADLDMEEERIEAIYLPQFHRAEMGIGAGITRLRGANRDKDRLAAFKTIANFDVVFDYLSNKENLTLNEAQRQAVRMALTEKVSVLTGGPGTGKTTSMRAVLRVLALKKKSFILAAPTGRAAKRLSEATGASATTIHRLLQLRPGGKAAFDRDTPLNADMVIVDEASMLDVLLMNNLLKAVPNGAHFLLVGDTDQLPSVGAGNVLSDIVNSETVPVVRLEQIFRQGSDSAIIVNAHRINQGQMPLVSREIKDFFFFAEDDTEKCSDLLVDLVSTRIPHKFGLDSLKDIQVLAPMHGTEAGVSKLNTRLQEVLNPPAPGKAERKWGGRLFRTGDKIMQTKNNYDKLVFNGDSGFVASIDSIEQVVQVRMDDGRTVEYDFTELDELTLAYAISVHKSQGSEYPVVVMPMVAAHYMMLQRNLFYTAVTRAKKVVVLVGSRRAMGMAVHNNKTSKRFSGLASRLRTFGIMM